MYMYLHVFTTQAWLYNVTPWIAKAISSFVSGWTAKKMIENGE